MSDADSKTMQIDSSDKDDERSELESDSTEIEVKISFRFLLYKQWMKGMANLL